MPFQIIRNDITRVAADAIVNTANPEPVIGGGTDNAVYQAAGAERLIAERRKIGKIAPGDARATPAFALKARYIIHTVGPIWYDGRHGESELLRSCYANSLALADTLGCTSIAFPMISTGVYGYPNEEALEIALSEIGKFLLTHEMDVTLVVFNRDTFDISAKRVGEIDAFIDEHTVEALTREEYQVDRHLPSANRRRKPRMLDFLEEVGHRITGAPSSESPDTDEDACFSAPMDGRPAMDRKPEKRRQPYKMSTSCPDDDALLMMAPCPEMKANSDNDEDLDSFLLNVEDTFQQRLMKLIYESGMDDVTVYKRANVDRKLFSFIRSHQEYRPKKQTAIAFGIALKLSKPAMEDLLNRAGFAFSPASKADLIITYFIQHGNYDIYQINAALFKYEQKTLG